MDKFKIGDRVLIHGDESDFTDDIDGEIGIVKKVRENDYLVEGYLFHRYIYQYNLEEAPDD